MQGGMRVRGRVRDRGRVRTNRDAEMQRGVWDRVRDRGSTRASSDAERQRHTKCLGLTLTLPLTLSLYFPTKP